MRLTRHKGGEPIVITGAPMSPRAEYDYRRKRYALTMGIRVLCLILAAVFYHVIWLWPIFALGAITLPWIAVVLANDRLPEKPSHFQRYFAGQRELPERRDSSDVIDE